MRVAAKRARDAANFVEKGKLDAQARHAQERITSAGQKVSAAQRSVLKFEERRKELEQQLKIAGFNCDAAVQEHERLVVESLKVVPSNPFPKYPSVDSFPRMNMNINPCPVCRRYFIARGAIFGSCGCLFHPYCMWQILSTTIRGAARVCPKCGKCMNGSWLAQWGLRLRAGKEEKEYQDIQSGDRVDWKKMKGPYFWDWHQKMAMTPMEQTPDNPPLHSEGVNPTSNFPNLMLPGPSISMEPPFPRKQTVVDCPSSTSSWHIQTHTPHASIIQPIAIVDPDESQTTLNDEKEIQAQADQAIANDEMVSAHIEALG